MNCHRTWTELAGTWGSHCLRGNSDAPVLSHWGTLSPNPFSDGDGNWKLPSSVRMGLTQPPVRDAVVSATINAHFHNCYLAFGEQLFYTQCSLKSGGSLSSHQ